MTEFDDSFWQAVKLYQNGDFNESRRVLMELKTHISGIDYPETNSLQCTWYRDTVWIWMIQDGVKYTFCYDTDDSTEIFMRLDTVA